MKLIRILLLVLSALGACSQAVLAAPTRWRSLTPGLEYAKIVPEDKFSNSALYAFQIDLQNYQLELAASQTPVRNTVRILALEHEALVAINAGFFGMDFRPLGLRVNQGEVYSRLRKSSQWSIFLVRNGRPAIVTAQQYQYSPNISFALQSSPRLVINGQIPKLKDGSDERSAICITRDRRVILAATYAWPMTTTQLAQILARSPAQGGLGCVDALNLDGGSSTQMYARVGQFELDTVSYKAVADVVLVKPKDSRN